LSEHDQSRQAQEESSVDTSGVDPEAFAGTIREASEEDLKAAMGGEMRGQILDEIFRRMEAHFQAEKAGGVDAVIHWQIGGRPDGGQDAYEVVIRDGKCAVSKDPASQPKVSFELDGVDFLRLVTGNASGPMMFMSGKLKIQGDLMFSARIQSLFAIPGGAPGGTSAPQSAGP
jgi:putative sterol carrier protein